MKDDGIQIKSDNLCGKYRELCDLIGFVAVEKLYLHYGGGYISLPKKFMADEFVHSYILECHRRGQKAKDLAKEYDYTYSWVLKIIRNAKITET